MEVELAGDPELEKDINPYNLPEVSKAINSDSEIFIGGFESLFFHLCPRIRLRILQMSCNN
jgi:hypothetical protein